MSVSRGHRVIHKYTFYSLFTYSLTTRCSLSIDLVIICSTYIYSDGHTTSVVIMKWACHVLSLRTYPISSDSTVDSYFHRIMTPVSNSVSEFRKALVKKNPVLSGACLKEGWCVMCDAIFFAFSLLYLECFVNAVFWYEINMISFRLFISGESKRE